MKHLFHLLFFSLLSLAVNGQNPITAEEGKVSFLSSRNVYVKFLSTENIQPGDTLFVRQNQELRPALIVGNKSSSSTVCKPIGPINLKVGDVVWVKIAVSEEIVESSNDSLPDQEVDLPIPIEIDPLDADEPAVASPYNEKIRGRISVATYNTLSSFRNSTRMRYAFLFRGHHLNNSKLSVDSYITFRHNAGEWTKVQESIGNALKIFALSAKYEFNDHSSLTIGRKINPKFSSVGAIDGVQYEHGFGDFQVGAIFGSRPDFNNYGINLNLLQYGAYISHIASKPGTYSQTTFGFIEQKNSGNTDRRFVYFQHAGELAQNLNLFSSFEVDLYEQINGQVNTSPRLTNLYLSLRYRASKALRFSVAYDNRRNIIFYESYKSFIDQLIQDETRQGFRVGFVYRPHENYSIGINANMRFQQSGINPSQNVNAVISIRNVPRIDARARITATYLQTSYFRSQIYGARIIKDLVPNALSGEIYYRWVDYQYITSISRINQHIGGASLSMRISKGLALNLFYEGVFEIPTIYHRVNARLIKRF